MYCVIIKVDNKLPKSTKNAKNPMLPNKNKPVNPFKKFTPELSRTAIMIIGKCEVTRSKGSEEGRGCDEIQEPDEHSTVSLAYAVSDPRTVVVLRKVIRGSVEVYP